MIYIWLGIKDYCKDCWHDFWFWFWNRIDDFTRHRLTRTYCWAKNEACYTKEGSVLHYIQQRKITKLLKEINQLQKEKEENAQR